VRRRRSGSGILLATAVVIGTASFAARAGESDQRFLAMPSGVLENSHEDGAAVELADGDVLVCGGNEGAACDRFSAETRRWSGQASLRQGRSRLALVRLDDGRLLAIGGEAAGGRGVTEVEVLTLGGNWTTHSRLPGPLTPVAEKLAGDGRLWVVGQRVGPGSAIDVYLGDPSRGTWQAIPGSPSFRVGAGGVTDDGDLFVVADGYDRTLPFASIFELEHRTWSRRLLSESERRRLDPRRGLEPEALQGDAWGHGIVLPLVSGGLLEIRPLPGGPQGIGVGWLLGAAAASDDPCAGVTAMIESLAESGSVARTGPSSFADVRPRDLDPYLPAACREVIASGQAPRLLAALSAATTLPIAAQFVNFFACTAGTPFDVGRMRAALTRRPSSPEAGSEMAMRERCLTTLASSSDPRAARLLDDYSREGAITVVNGTTVAGGLRRPLPTVDAALIETLKQAPALRPLGADVLRRALAQEAVGSSGLHSAVCSQRSPAGPPAADFEVCRTESDPETHWELVPQRRRRVLLLGVNAVIAAGVMAAGVVTRNDADLRAVSVLAATAGGARGGFALGVAYSRPCRGMFCEWDEMFAGGLFATLGAGAGFGLGMLLSSLGSGGRVAATGLGVVSYLGGAAASAFTDWSELEVEPIHD
jgi:hypothetical protein